MTPLASSSIQLSPTGQCYAVFLQKCGDGAWHVGPGQSGQWERVLPFYAGEVGQSPPQHREATISSNTINKGDSVRKTTCNSYSQAKLSIGSFVDFIVNQLGNHSLIHGCIHYS